MKYSAIPNPQNKLGTADGVLIGGNLKTIETLSGTASDINTTGKLLFVEDTFEYLYSIDRMFWNLKRTGKLKELKGLIIGGFNPKPDDPGEEFGQAFHLGGGHVLTRNEDILVECHVDSAPYGCL